MSRVGAGRLELPISCPQSRRASHYATPRGACGSLEAVGTRFTHLVRLGLAFGFALGLALR